MRSPACRWAALRALLLAAAHPERVDGVFVARPAVPLPDAGGRRNAPASASTTSARTYEGWAKYNRHYWLRDYRGFLEFFFGKVFPEPHSTKQIEDCVAWGLDTTPETLVADHGRRGLGARGRERVEELLRSDQCPVARRPRRPTT